MSSSAILYSNCVVKQCAVFNCYNTVFNKYNRNSSTHLLLFTQIYMNSDPLPMKKNAQNCVQNLTEDKPTLLYFKKLVVFENVK